MSVEAEILKESKVVAVVGLSPEKERPSYSVASYLKENGYKIIPVNPNYHEILGEKSFPDLGSVTKLVDVVDIFRRSEAVPEIVDQAIKIGAKAVWMQEGVVSEPAAAKARQAGLKVVMNKCMRKEHEKIKQKEMKK